MIDAECPRCGAQGPYPVREDTGCVAEAVCADCGCVMHVVLYDNNQEVPNRAKD